MGWFWVLGVVSHFPEVGFKFKTTGRRTKTNTDKNFVVEDDILAEPKARVFGHDSYITRLLSAPLLKA